MNTHAIVSALDQKIDRLQQARLLLQDVTDATPFAADPGKRRGRPPGKATPVSVQQTQTISEERRPRVAAAQTARWAKKKKAEKKAEKKAAKAAASSPANPKKVAAPAKKTVGAKAATAKSAAKKVTAQVKKAAAKKASGPVKKSVRNASQSVESAEPINVPAPLAPVKKAVAAE